MISAYRPLRVFGLAGIVLLLATMAGAIFALNPGDADPDKMMLPTPVQEGSVVSYGIVDVEQGVIALYPLQPGRVVEVKVKDNAAVKAGGTDVYWAPNETRAVKAKLAGGAKVSLCEAAENDAWFGVVFAAPGTDPDMCGVGKSVSNTREYQGPCRWGWIKGGTVQLGG